MNRENLVELIRANQAEVYRYLRYLGADRAEADDLMQDTFVRAFEAKSYREDESPRAQAAWLRAIARNLYLKARIRARSAPVQADSRMVEARESVWSGEFLRGGDGFDYLEALRKCLASLPERQRQAVAMRYTDGASRDEMAGLLGLAPDGVKALLRRIRASLAECVGHRLAHEGA